MCVCVYLCMYIYMYVCTCACVCMYVCMCACRHACMYVCMYVCTHTYTHTHTHTHTYTYIHTGRHTSHCSVFLAIACSSDIVSCQPSTSPSGSFIISRRPPGEELAPSEEIRETYCLGAFSEPLAVVVACNVCVCMCARARVCVRVGGWVGLCVCV